MSDNRRNNAYEDGWIAFDEGKAPSANDREPGTVLHDDWAQGYHDILRATYGNVPMSTCDTCGRQFPRSRPNVIHKCQCTGGMMIPNDATALCEEVSLDEPAPKRSDADVLFHVQQIDREAAADMYLFVHSCLKNPHPESLQKTVEREILAGRWDDDESVQAFVRHRIQPRKQFEETVAKVVPKGDAEFLDLIEKQGPGKVERLVDIDFGDIEMRVLANAEAIREEMRETADEGCDHPSFTKASYWWNKRCTSCGSPPEYNGCH